MRSRLRSVHLDADDCGLASSNLELVVNDTRVDDIGKLDIFE